MQLATESTEPLVTLVMPSYNRGARIERAIRSVLKQTRLPDEILVVNDGGCPETAEWLAANAPQVTVLNVPHGGASLARNRGVEAAKGSIVVLFDDDDEMEPACIWLLLDLLRRFPEARSAHTDHTFTNLVTGEHHPNHHRFLPQYRRLAKTPFLRQEGDARLYGQALHRTLIDGNLVQQPWAIYRQTYQELGGFRSNMVACDDWDLFLRLTDKHPIVISDAITSRHYLEANRPHLTLAPGQLEPQRVILRDELNKLPLVSWWQRGRIRRRLAMFDKMEGDQAAHANLRQAWSFYVRSFRNWPWDAAVAWRTLTWPIYLCFSR